MLRHSLLIILLLCTSCAYQFGYQSRKLPEAYNQVAVPVFINNTYEVGIEAYLTSALILEFERSRVARVIAKDRAPVYVRGTVTQVSIKANSQVAANNKNEDLAYLPRNTVLNTTYRLVVGLTLDLIRRSDKKVIWTQNFSSERVYNSAQVSLPELNTANPLYNNSAKHQNMKLIAQDLMKEAHDRMTERF